MKNNLLENYSVKIENLFIKGGKSTPFVAALAGIALIAIAAFSTASAQAGSCGITQLTSSTASPLGGGSIATFGGYTSDDGSLVAFTSDADFTGGNPDHNREVFVRSSALGFIQITNTTGSSIFSYPPVISGNGKLIVFISNGNFTGANADGTLEYFLFDVDSNLFTQITETTPLGNPGLAVISRDGTKVAFSSQQDVNGLNPDFSTDAFLYDVESKVLTNLTSLPFTFSYVYSISGDGSRVAIMSGADLVAPQNSDGNYEIFIYDTSAGFRQLTSTTGASIYSWGPIISDDGQHVLYSSNVVNVGNPDGNAEVYLRDLTKDTLTRITTSTGLGSTAAAISGDGSRAVILSYLDLTGQNADGNGEIFLYDSASKSLTQISDTPSTILNYDPEISHDGKRVFWDSNGYPESNGDGNREIFMYECQPAPVADLKVSLGVSNLNPKQGDKITYTITVANNGPSTAANVVVNDVLSSGTTFVSAQVNKGTFTAPVAGQSGTIVWHPGDMTSGASESAQIKVTVIVKGKTTVTNTATVSSDATDPSPADNSASVTVSVASGTSKK